ncbi:sulfatase-like hydrolase/transferase [Desulfofundulus thermobenzoicus]|uniref:Sulfatase-like hydrolase/transferase n=1 Tax=Desulfofundulus thermobenzoicus TaxID=29376 RepID=A0A6N7IRL7_9FIRM|nr:alkaline phosphatase [Desulfofundulus thermobenzoicus]MQL51778.1 sulfatase-like hydrolase/transferase [Desulfofundulus thermobenzoicus]
MHGKSIKRDLRRVLALVIALALVVACLPVVPAQASTPTVKNVILLIGDGMGFEHMEAARAAVGGHVYMDDVNDATGRVTTYSADADITDSAAAATALATGYKTLNRMLGMTPDDDQLTPDEVPTLVELAEDRGLATGLVTTTQMAHATPAGFASHVPHRNQFNNIAAQYFDNFAARGKPIEVLMGGGRNNFDDRAKYTSGVKYGDKTDNRNLIQEFTAKGYQYAANASELERINGDRVLGLFHADNGLTQEQDRLDKGIGQDEPHLADMTAKALEVLAKNSNGFFLMVEGGQIDWASHANDFDNMIGETLAFDRAVKAALDFQATHPGTLVIVTADHETGGLNYNGPNDYTWSSTDHTAALVPIMAEGPGAELFSGTMDNTEIPRKIAQLLNLDRPLVLQHNNAVAGQPTTFTVTSMGLPVPGAIVTVKDAAKDNKTLASLTADVNGQASYTFAAAGDYKLAASKDGYKSTDEFTITVKPAVATAPKKVVLLIGDGMGYEHMKAARAERGSLYMDTVNDATGRMTTHSADAAITDSSSAATAMATGYKINNNVLGILPDGKTSVPTLVELAEDKGLATGLVTTTQIAHATPAGFATHVKHRDMFNTIAAQYFDNFAAKGKPIEVLMGGGRDNFDNRASYTKGAKYGDITNDGRNLINEFTAKGYQFAGTASELARVTGDKVLGLFEPKNGLTQEKDRQPGNTEPHLNEMTAKALDVLAKNSNGFFLMVEGGQIDWASHANDFDNMVGETLAFDDAVKAALDFQANHPDTLVIVTADHETGGLKYNGPNNYSWSSTDHTAALVPVMAEGPGAELFNGTMDNTDIARKIAQLLNLNRPLVLQYDEATAGRPATFTVTSMGMPVPGAVVTVKEGNKTLASLTTDVSGKASYTFAKDGQYQVTATKDGYVDSPEATLGTVPPASGAATITGLAVRDENHQPVTGGLTRGKQYYLTWKAKNNAAGSLPGLAILEVLGGSQPVFLNAARLQVPGSPDTEYSVLFQPSTSGTYTVKGLFWNDWSTNASWQSLADPVETSITVN